MDESAPADERGGSGTLLLPADGSAVYSDDLPHGTLVSVDEVNVISVNGATWADPELSIREFMIDATVDEMVHVTLTNVLTRDSGVFNAKKLIVNEQTLTCRVSLSMCWSTRMSFRGLMPRLQTLNEAAREN